MLNLSIDCIQTLSAPATTTATALKTTTTNYTFNLDKVVLRFAADITRHSNLGLWDVFDENVLQCE